MLRTADKTLALGRELGQVIHRYEPISLTSEGELSASSNGTLVTPGGVAHTKTAWVQIVAATAAQADGFFLNIQPGDTGIADFLVDVGIGAAASETVIVSNLLYTSGIGDAAPGRAYFPIPIAPGTRIAVRAQCSDTASASVRMILTLVTGGISTALVSRQATTYGADTSDSGGTAVDAGGSTHTKGAWAELTSSVTRDFHQCVICVGNRNNAANTQQNILLDLGVGGAGSETVVVPDLYFRGRDQEEVVPKMSWVPLTVRAGQRLAARIQSSTNDATDRVIDVVVIGFS